MDNTADKTKTPGYNSRLTIGFKYNKRGRKCAYYLSRFFGSHRWIRMSLANAEIFVAGNLANEGTVMTAKDFANKAF